MDIEKHKDIMMLVMAGTAAFLLVLVGYIILYPVIG